MVCLELCDFGPEFLQLQFLLVHLALQVSVLVLQLLVCVYLDLVFVAELLQLHLVLLLRHQSFVRQLVDSALEFCVGSSLCLKLVLGLFQLL